MLDGGGFEPLEAEYQVVNQGSAYDHIHGPCMLYFPEKDRILIVANACDYSTMKYNTVMMISDDRGASWRYSFPVNALGETLDFTYCSAIGNLGGGRVILHSADGKRAPGEIIVLQFSEDYGETWTSSAVFPAEAGGKDFYSWGDAFLVEEDLIILGGYIEPAGRFEDSAKSISGLRFSHDSGMTWTGMVQVPEWIGFNEVQLVRAANGDLVAGLRRDYPRRVAKYGNDNTGGLGVSRSTDNGSSWSEVQVLYDWGRHFPSMTVMPRGEIIMTYVMRMGYPETAEGGLPQFGIEAVISRDHGRTWDLDHRYLLADWAGKTRSPLGWLYGCQSTSTVRLPDDSLITVYSNGYRSTANSKLKANGAAYDVCLIHWTPDMEYAGTENEVTLAPFDSDLRNMACAHPDLDSVGMWIKYNRNIAIADRSAVVAASEHSPEDASLILYNRYNRNLLRFETIPASLEISWPEEHVINEIHIHAGALFQKRDPETECVPLDYRLQSRGSDGDWRDIIEPILDAARYTGPPHLIASDVEFEYVHIFEPVRTDAIRMIVTRSSDTGKRRHFGELVIVPEGKRKTVIRCIEVMSI